MSTFTEKGKMGISTLNSLLFSLIMITSIGVVHGQDLGAILEIPTQEGKQYLDPYFSLDELGNTIICFTEYDVEKDENVMCLSKYVSIEKGFQSIQYIEESRGMQAHAESMSKIGIKSDGTIIALFRIKESNPNNRFAGSLYFVKSSDQGKTWTTKEKLVQDPAAQSQSFFDIARLGNGELGIVWLDSRKVENQTFGSCLYFGTTGGTIDFSNQKVIVSGTCQCCRTDIQVSQDNKVHVALRMMNEENIRDMYYMSSLNDGLIFSEKVNISPDQWKVGGCPHTGPSMAGGEDKLGVAWYTMGGSPGVYFCYNESGSFSPRILIEEHGAHPQLVKSGADSYGLVYELTSPETKEFDREISLSWIQKGKEINRLKISQGNSDNSHPVIASLSDGKVLIAWSEIGESVSRLKYRIMEISN